MRDLEAARARREIRQRDELIVGALPLADRLTREYRAETVPYEELLVAAWHGLTEAADEFDPTATPEFSALACTRIRGELAHHVAEPSPQRTAEADETERRISELLARQPRLRGLADLLGCPVDAVVGGLLDTVAQEHLHVQLGRSAA